MRLQEVALTPIMHHLAPGRMCQLVWSVGQLGLRPHGQFIKQVLRSSSRGMSFLGGQDLCQLLQGFVQLDLQLPSLWLDGCCARVLQVGRGLEMRQLGTGCFGAHVVLGQVERS